MAADWTREGDYALVKEPLMRGGDPVIYLAGEHLCWRHQGYMNGAYDSGLEATQSILQYLLETSDFDNWSPMAQSTDC